MVPNFEAAKMQQRIGSQADVRDMRLCVQARCANSDACQLRCAKVEDCCDAPRTISGEHYNSKLWRGAETHYRVRPFLSEGQSTPWPTIEMIPCSFMQRAS